MTECTKLHLSRWRARRRPSPCPGSCARRSACSARCASAAAGRCGSRCPSGNGPWQSWALCQACAGTTGCPFVWRGWSRTVRGKRIRNEKLIFAYSRRYKHAKEHETVNIGSICSLINRWTCWYLFKLMFTRFFFFALGTHEELSRASVWLCLWILSSEKKKENICFPSSSFVAGTAGEVWLGTVIYIRTASVKIIREIDRKLFLLYTSCELRSAVSHSPPRVGVQALGGCRCTTAASPCWLLCSGRWRLAPPEPWWRHTPPSCPTPLCTWDEGENTFPLPLFDNSMLLLLCDKKTWDLVQQLKC